MQSKNNRQGRGEVLEGDAAARVLDLLRRDAETAYGSYEEMIEGHALARELARMNLPVNYYTQWYWKIDLHNLLHFLRLRADAHAQYEIRAYADVIGGIAERWVPTAYAAFRNYRLGAETFSAQGMGVLRRMLSGEAVTQESSGMSKGEWREFQEMLTSTKT